MISDGIRKKLQNIVGGTLLEEQKDHCTAIRNLLCRSFETGPTIKSKFESRAILKEEQIGFLKAHVDKTGYWLPSLPSIPNRRRRGGNLLCSFSILLTLMGLQVD